MRGESLRAAETNGLIVYVWVHGGKEFRQLDFVKTFLDSPIFFCFDLDILKVVLEQRVSNLSTIADGWNLKVEDLEKEDEVFELLCYAERQSTIDGAVTEVSLQHLQVL